MNQAVMFGAGNVGRGFIGQLFSESGFEVTFVDVDDLLLAALSSRRAYTIQLVDNESSHLVEVAPVSALHSARQAGEVAAVLAQASLAATAVGARILPLIAPLVAEGIRLRAQLGSDGHLNIIICENLKGAAALFRQMVESHLPEDLHHYSRERVGFVDTVIGRMVPPPTPEMRAADPSLILVEPYKELPVDRSGFVGEIPTVVGMQPSDNFPAFTARKLYIHNCGHAVLAYLGYLRGYEFGYQALTDAWVRPILEQALRESRLGIVTEYGVEDSWLQSHADELLKRFANRSLGDTIFRLGRDPLRKLDPHDRLVGAARLAEKAGIFPQALSWGIAAGYCFDPAEDPLAADLQKRIAAHGIEAALADVSGILPTEPLGALVLERYRSLREGRGQ